VLSRDLGAIRGGEPGTQHERSIRSWLIGCALMAGGYLLAGRLGQLLAVPPDYATVVWPASGIALAGMLLANNRVWPGVYVGAVLINSWTGLLEAVSFQDVLDAFPVPIAIGVGAVAQAWIGANLIRRYIGYPNALIQDRLVLGFLALGGPIACLVGATVGVASLRIAGEIETSEVALNWLTWWVGDTIGVIIFAPLTIICLGRPRHAWRPRLLSVALPTSAAFGTAVAAFVWIHISEQSSLRSRFNDVADNATQQLEEQLLGHLDALYAVEGFYAGSRSIGRGEFASFNRHSLSRHAGIDAVAWLPRIDHSDREDHETQAQVRGHSDYQITDLGADQSYQPSAEREEYFPVYYLEPQDSVTVALGFDAATIPVLKQAMEKCRDASQHVATGPVFVEEEDARVKRVIVFAPIYAKDQDLVAVEDRAEILRGYVASVFDVSEIVRAALPEWDSEEFDLTIIDETMADGNPVVYVQPSRLSGHKPTEVVPALRQVIESARWIRLADRRWRCKFKPTPAFYTAWANRNTWWIFLSGLALTAMLGAFLLILSGRTARIEASESRYLDLYEHAPDMFISIDVTTQRVTECNKTIVEATGFTRTEIVDRHIYDLFDAESRTEVRRARQRFLDSGRAKDVELRLVCSDGRLLDTSMNVLAIRDQQGQSILFRAVLRDITDKKGVEIQMKQQEQDLAHVARLSMMGEMATGLAHEINQPLAAIAAYAEGALIRIRGGNHETSSLSRVLARIAADAHRAGEVISRLRQFVKNQEPDRRDIDLNELVREVAQFVGPDTKRREVMLGLDLQEPLPTVNGDAIQIQQVLLNLVRNGCDAMSDVDPIRRQVTIRTRCNGENEVELSVDDCGHGIPQGVDLKVFEAFFTTKKDGIGLGLAISRSIVESHGGRIWATPNLDGGTSFQFSLPSTNGVPQHDSGGHSISG
jgi:PAS domain S-box-containing protein